LAYVVLVAFGTAAEPLGIARLYKANTRNERVMALARTGNHVLELSRCSRCVAFSALVVLPTQNWGTLTVKLRRARPCAGNARCAG